MSGLAIAFPAEAASRVAQLVMSTAAEIGWPLIAVGGGVVLLLVCAPGAVRVADALRERLAH